MSLLFAHIEHQIRSTAATIGRTIVEKVTGFSDPTGRQLPDEELCDWLRDVAGLAKSEDHTGYYEYTPTCARQLSALDGVLHACYSHPGHDGDHGCLCGHVFPAGVSAEDQTTTAPPAGINWVDWAIPAICEVLAEHQAWLVTSGNYRERVHCYGTGEIPHAFYEDQQAWREHVAPLIAERLDAAMLGPAGQAADERIAAALRAAGFQQRWAAPAICSAIFNHK